MARLALLLSLGLTGWDAPPAPPHPSEPASPAQVRAAPATPEAPITQRVAGLEPIPGFIPAWWDERQGKILLELTLPREEMIYQVSLATGVGSNPIGLDRGQLGPTYLARFERAGPRVLLIARGLGHRALAASAAETAAVEQSFAESVLAALPIVAEDGGRVLADANPLLLSDVHGIALRLKQAGQGSYRLDDTRSAIHRAGSRGFPRNTELESRLTFLANDAPGALVASVAPDGGSPSLRVRHSFVALPDSGFTPRAADPRIGHIQIEIADYASPIAGPLEKHWILRHRDGPVVYHVDPGIPEPVRSAVIEGARWWSGAFAAAGFRDGFRVELLPLEADPLDVRYNMIHWVHRDTRGWSYGSSVVDPRTGEIVRGVVQLGSLRLRQDVLIASGLVPQWPDEAGAAARVQADPRTSAVELALARIRQLSAHEVGHAIGLEHNFAASTRKRASVMDYPAPLVRIRDGGLDLSDAYARDIGDYDRWAVRYAYGQPGPGEVESAWLERVVAEGLAAGLAFVQDSDARPVASAHPLGSLWDNGSDPVAELGHEIEVRRIALARLGPSCLAPGAPLGQLEDVLLPLYLHHRYALEAAAKLVGGVEFHHARRGGGPEPARRPVARPQAEAALDAMLVTLAPRFLAVPRELLRALPPASPLTSSRAERFARRTGAPFDPLTAAEGSIDITLNALLAPERLARLVTLSAEDHRLLDLQSLLDRLVARAFAVARPGDPLEAALARLVEERVIAHLIRVAADGRTLAEVRALAEETLSELRERLRPVPAGKSERAHRRARAGDIARFLGRSGPELAPPAALSIPPGPPIGASERWCSADAGPTGF